MHLFQSVKRVFIISDIPQHNIFRPVEYFLLIVRLAVRVSKSVILMRLVENEPEVAKVLFNFLADGVVCLCILHGDTFIDALTENFTNSPNAFVR